MNSMRRTLLNKSLPLARRNVVLPFLRSMSAASAASPAPSGSRPKIHLNQKPAPKSPKKLLDQKVPEGTPAAQKACVHKFGGSSLGSAEAIRNVCNIIRKSTLQFNGVAVVLSAMMGTTDRLVAAGEEAARGNLEKSQMHRRAILQLHELTVKDLFDKEYPDVGYSVLEKIRMEMYTDFDTVISTTALNGKLLPSDSDLLHSVGERLSSLIVSEYLICTGTRSKLVQPSYLIITDGNHGNSIPNLKQSGSRLKSRLNRLFEADIVPIVPGFYGGSADSSNITTFGRGGSDLTAAVVGHAVDAAEVILWKVECEKDARTGRMKRWLEGWTGIVHSVEPTTTIPLISYRDAQEMAHFGKKVLHPQTVFPVVEKGIPVRVANTMDPTKKGTLIAKECEADDPSRPLSVISVPASKVPHYNDDPTCAAVVAHDQAALKDGSETTMIVLIGISNIDEQNFQTSATKFTRPLMEANIPFLVPEKVNGSSRSVAIVVSKDHGKEAATILHECFVSC